MPRTMDGEVVFGTGAYEGKMRMTMTGSSQAMQMTYSGKRTGSCTARPSRTGRSRPVARAAVSRRR